MEAFLELLMVYLQSTVVGVGKDLYVQKAGVCIGSAVAPILSDMFLSRVDRKVSDSLAGTAEHILRYVDDYLVFVPKDNYNQNVINVLKVFRENSCGLKFTIECVQDKSLQFLDIKLLFKADHVCWRYSPRAKKPLLNFASSHSKVIKNAIASSCFRSSLLWSCVHEIASSFQDQLGRLRAVGYPSHLLNTICKRLIPVIKGTERSPKRIQSEKRKLAVLPYVHRLSHGLKNVAARYGVTSVFTAPNKLSKLCPRLRNMVESGTTQSKNSCQMKHSQQYRSCRTAVVYQVPFSGGRSYVG